MFIAIPWRLHLEEQKWIYLQGYVVGWERNNSPGPPSVIMAVKSENL